MTGFGVGEAPLAGGRLIAEVRSVNHRFLDVRTRLPRELAELSIFAEQVVRQRLRRGRCELTLRLEGATTTSSIIDLPKARAAFRALAHLRDELSPSAELPLSLLGAIPDLFSPPPASDSQAVRDTVRDAIVLAIANMDRMCAAEGQALARDLAARATLLREHLSAIGGRAEGARDATAKRLRERIQRLLSGADFAIDPTRLEIEVALVADRSDITEEITRIHSHLAQFEKILNNGVAAGAGTMHEPPASGRASSSASLPAGESVEPVGRRIDFLLQEMMREINTIGAKAQDAAISHEVVAIKVEVERIREQVQNVE